MNEKRKRIDEVSRAWQGGKGIYGGRVDTEIYIDDK